MLEQRERSQISDQEAKVIADQLRRVLAVEKTAGYNTERGATDYISALRGVRHTFGNVLNLDTRTILDIGTGSGKAVFQLARKEAFRYFDFKATGLTVPPKIDEYIGADNFTLTAAEVLRGIPDNSVGAAISVFSVTYSAAPARVADSIDRVLVEGGVFKAALRPSRKRFRQGQIKGMTILKDMDAVNGRTYKELFDEKGYDTYLGCSKDRDILVAIKPGTSKKNSAAGLYMNEFVL